MGGQIGRWTGIAGITAYVLTMAVLPLWFLDPGAPAIDTVLLRTTLNLFVVAATVVFWVGFRHLVGGTRNAATNGTAFLATIALVAAVMYLVLNLTSEGLQLGSVLTGDGDVDPTRLGGGAEGAILLFGPAGRVLTALTLAAAAGAIRWSGVLPRWLSTAALVVAAVHLALVPTMFSSTDPADFYAINGWNIPVAGGLYLLWVLAAGVVLLRRRDDVPDGAPIGGVLPAPAVVTDDDLLGLQRDVVEPIARSILRDDELETIRVYREDGSSPFHSRGDIWVTITAKGETFMELVGSGSWAVDVVAERLVDHLEDWVCETRFAWGERREASLDAVQRGDM